MELIKFNKLLEQIKFGNYAKKIDDKLIEIDVIPEGIEKTVRIKINGKRLYDVYVSTHGDKSKSNFFEYSIYNTKEKCTSIFKYDTKYSSPMIKLDDGSVFVTNRIIRFSNAKEFHITQDEDLIYRRIDWKTTLGLDLNTGKIYVYIKKDATKNVLFNRDEYFKIEYKEDLNFSIETINDRFQLAKEFLEEKFKSSDIYELVSSLTIPKIDLSYKKEDISELEEAYSKYSYYKLFFYKLDSDDNLKNIMDFMEEILFSPEKAELIAFQTYVANNDITDLDSLKTIKKWTKRIFKRNGLIKTLKNED